MKRDRLTPAIGLAVLIFGTAVFGTAADRKKESMKTPPALPVITSEVQPMTVDELHARLLRVLNASMPGSYMLDVDKDAQTITVDTWVDGTGAAVPNAALHASEYLAKWNDLVREYVLMCGDMQAQVSNHGHPEYAVITRMVNCDDYGQIFAVAERGELVYDVVADTPPGCEVPDPKKRIMPTNTDSVLGTYVVNSNSKIFHTKDCRYAPQISANWRHTFTGDRLDLIAQGFVPCKVCSP